MLRTKNVREDETLERNKFNRRDYSPACVNAKLITFSLSQIPLSVILLIEFWMVIGYPY
jgi:hypothetical protein